MGSGAAATGQGAPQAQAVAAPLQAQGNPRGGQEGVLALDLGIQGGARGGLRGASGAASVGRTARRLRLGRRGGLGIGRLGLGIGRLGLGHRHVCFRSPGRADPIDGPTVSMALQSRQAQLRRCSVTLGVILVQKPGA